jgi:hypothetical protein
MGERGQYGIVVLVSSRERLPNGEHLDRGAGGADLAQPQGLQDTNPRHHRAFRQNFALRLLCRDEVMQQFLINLLSKNT